ncbi:MAG: hypothetical protein AAB152_10235 [Candidatus Coatesbacteria bacterium]
MRIRVFEQWRPGRAVVAYPIVALAMVAGILAGCGKARAMGAAVPADWKPVALAEVLGAPKAWSGKSVVLEGEVSWVCPEGCDFTYTEGTKSVTVYPRDMALKGLKKGAKIRMLAQVTAGKERIVVNALGIVRL